MNRNEWTPFTDHDLSSIPEAEVAESEIRKYRDEEQFTAQSVELLKEAGQLFGMISCILPAKDGADSLRWNREQAIVGGLMIRACKLQMAIFDQCCKRRLEVVYILFRCLMETLINVEYLLHRGDAPAYKEFLEYSLRTEKNLLTFVKEQVEAREEELPFESRIIESVLRAFANSGFELEDVDTTNRRTWGGSVFQRAKAVGLDTIYLPIYSLPNHAVHGNWQDLITHHVEQVGDSYYPSPAWTRPRPQLIFAAVHLSVHAADAYLQAIAEEGAVRESILNRLLDLDERLRMAWDLHETFLQNR